MSSWQLAGAVSRRGQLGVISASAIDTVLVRRLQDGDEGGHVRRAMRAYPLPETCEVLMRRYYLAPGARGSMPYQTLPMYRQSATLMSQRITMLASFVEVWLAKEGHDGVVGISLATTVQMPALPSLYGAMLAGVDYVLMGPGIPREIPVVLDALAEHRAARIALDVNGPPSPAADELVFDPRAHLPGDHAPLRRPRLLPVVSSGSAATMFADNVSCVGDGVIVDGPIDAPLGLPYWLADSAATPEALRAALSAGAAGVQIEALFAYCHESGLASGYKARVRAGVAAGRVHVQTEPRPSPTGYALQIICEDGAQDDDHRVRRCDLGYFRTAYRMPGGKIGYRCAAEPVDQYVGKGGDVTETVGRRCLCNALTANIGQAQHRDEGDEGPLLPGGDDLSSLHNFARGRAHYSANDVLAYLLAP